MTSFVEKNQDQKLHYDLIVVGTGFASSFFLKRFLERSPQNVRVLVLEQGQRHTHAWQLAHKEQFYSIRENTFFNLNPKKPWIHTPTFGGGSNCWWACTPRFMPNDFKLRSNYGVGSDWPISYQDLEPYYQLAEETMSISGPRDQSPFPRSKPYPQPPHRFSDPDRLLKRAFPDKFFELPTARARIATGKRPACCATGICELCPIDAKFTIENELGYLYQDSRIELRLGAQVQRLETANGLVSGVQFLQQGKPVLAQSDLVALGANALFNPFILLRSGFDHPLVGAGLHEQMSVSVIFDLAGVENFQGSTSFTGHGYMLYDGPQRANHAACLIETSNIPDLRIERGRWRERLQMKFIFEDLPEDNNRVSLAHPDDQKPTVFYTGHSEYAKRGLGSLWNNINSLFRALPIERIVGKIYNDTESHILGTVRMGSDASNSVVDRTLKHHAYRNLLVLGGSSFPSCGPANPTLTISALSLWAADNLY